MCRSFTERKTSRVKQTKKKRDRSDRGGGGKGGAEHRVGGKQRFKPEDGQKKKAKGGQTTRPERKKGPKRLEKRANQTLDPDKKESGRGRVPEGRAQQRRTNLNLDTVEGKKNNRPNQAKKKKKKGRNENWCLGWSEKGAKIRASAGGCHTTREDLQRRLERHLEGGTRLGG